MSTTGLGSWVSLTNGVWRGPSGKRPGSRRFRAGLAGGRSLWRSRVWTGTAVAVAAGAGQASGNREEGTHVSPPACRPPVTQAEALPSSLHPQTRSGWGLLPCPPCQDLRTHLLPSLRPPRPQRDGGTVHLSARGPLGLFWAKKPYASHLTPARESVPFPLLRPPGALCRSWSLPLCSAPGRRCVGGGAAPAGPDLRGLQCGQNQRPARLGTGGPAARRPAHVSPRRCLSGVGGSRTSAPPSRGPDAFSARRLLQRGLSRPEFPSRPPAA